MHIFRCTCTNHEHRRTRHGFEGKVVRHHRRWRRHRQGRGAAVPRRGRAASCSAAPAGRSSRRRATSSTRRASASRSSPGRSRAARQAQALSTPPSSASAASTCSSTRTGIFRIVPFLEQTEEHLEEALGSILHPTYWVSQAAAARDARARRRRDRQRRLDVGHRRDRDDADQRLLGRPGRPPRADQEPRARARAGGHPHQHGRARLRRDARLRALPLATTRRRPCSTPSTASTRSAATASRATWSRRSLFLAGDRAGWITGTTLPVDGGVLAGRSPALQPRRRGGGAPPGIRATGRPS